VVVTANNTNPVTATATVAGALPDPNAANNTANVNTDVVVVAGSTDLVLTVADAPDPVTAGESLVYTATVRNAGPDAVTGVQMNASAPSGAILNQVTPSQGTCTTSGSAVSCALGSLANGATATVAINVTPTTVGTIALTANLTSALPDPALGNNSASQSTTVTAVPPGQNDCSAPAKPQIVVTRNGGQSLRVVVTAGTNATLRTNSLVELRFGNATNALIDIPGGQTGLTGNVTVPVPAGASQTSFIVRRLSSNGAATVSLTVVDLCGTYPTFVGGGPSAFQ
jgi:uncharacterized repeat protein (TIGR01451 family)